MQSFKDQALSILTDVVEFLRTDHPHAHAQVHQSLKTLRYLILEHSISPDDPAATPAALMRCAIASIQTAIRNATPAELTILDDAIRDLDYLRPISPGRTS